MSLICRSTRTTVALSAMGYVSGAATGLCRGRRMIRAPGYPSRTAPAAPARSRNFPTMTDTPPARLALDPRSPYYAAAMLDRGVGVRFNGQERDNVEEYSVSEGWIRVQVGRSRDRRGNPMTIKVKGTVEPYFLVARE